MIFTEEYDVSIAKCLGESHSLPQHWGSSFLRKISRTRTASHKFLEGSICANRLLTSFFGCGSGGVPPWLRGANFKVCSLIGTRRVDISVPNPSDQRVHGKTFRKIAPCNFVFQSAKLKFSSCWLFHIYST
jgi:hypothetical protein